MDKTDNPNVGDLIVAQFKGEWSDPNEKLWYIAKVVEVTDTCLDVIIRSNDKRTITKKKGVSYERIFRTPTGNEQESK